MKKGKRKTDKNISRYRVEVTEGHPHGDVYELEITTYFDIIDNRTNEIVMAFRGEYSAKLDSGGWGDSSYWGVESVVISDDGTQAIVYENGNKEPKFVKLPTADD